MKQAHHELFAATNGRGLYEITRKIENWCGQADIRDGLLTLFIRHTSASLLIQENADPDVMHDLNGFLDRLVPDDIPLYRHIAEGADDMPAHIRSALTQTSLSIPVLGGIPVLGTWQGIYIFEHRTHPHERSIALHLIGD